MTAEFFAERADDRSRRRINSVVSPPRLPPSSDMVMNSSASGPDSRVVCVPSASLYLALV